MSADIGLSVRDRLAATSQVTAITSRIYADVLPADYDIDPATKQPIRPAPAAVVVFVPSTTVYEDLNTADRYGPAIVEVFAYGGDRKEANALAKVIRDNALAANLSGQIEGMDWKEVTLIAGPAEVVDQPQDGSDHWRRITQQTFSIWADAL